MNNANVYEISYGEFMDKSLEKDFFEYDIGGASRHIRPVTIASGFLFMLFIIPDYFMMKNKITLINLFTVRTVVLIITLTLFLIEGRMKDYKLYTIGVAALEIVLSVAVIAIYFIYEFNDFSIQALRVIIILFVIYMIPNKWLYTVIASITAGTVFSLISLYFVRSIRVYDFFAGTAYIFIVITLSGISSYRNHRCKRLRYIERLELLQMSRTDSLTGIYNRGKFNEELTKWMKYSKRYKTPLSLVIFDFDDFKQINDNYGHLLGDRVIVNTTGVISKTIRQSDVFARWGGEEFAILLPNTDIHQALELMERIRELVAGNILECGKYITCSFGLASMEAGDTEDALLRRADKLLYEAKKAGKNTIVSQKDTEYAG